MSMLLEGKCALVLGVANRWSLAYAIAEAFRREGASLILTYQGERQRDAVETVGQELGATQVLPCDVGNDGELAQLTEKLSQSPGRLDAVVHSIAFANRADGDSLSATAPTFFRRADRARPARRLLGRAVRVPREGHTSRRRPSY